MTRYIFSKGQVQIADETLRQPVKRRHPLGPTVLFVVTVSDWFGKTSESEKRKEKPCEQRKHRA